MTIHLLRSNCLILMTPKCGSNWIRAAIDRLSIEHTDIEPNRNGGHHPLHEFDLSAFSRLVAVVREPVGWYYSYWAYRQRVGWGTARIDQIARSDDFFSFIEKVARYCPGYATDLYRQYTGEKFSRVHYVGDLGQLNRFIREVLIDIGELNFGTEPITAAKLNHSSLPPQQLEGVAAIVAKMDRESYDYFAPMFAWSTTNGQNL